ncbi:MAG: PQQ-dependent sugar dehydrogenase [Acidimicrobiales bacterium]|nr:PQQ-dependent sugar dehydrogenase [Acidimicrobiales bacterium]
MTTPTAPRFHGARRVRAALLAATLLIAACGDDEPESAATPNAGDTVPGQSPGTVTDGSDPPTTGTGDEVAPLSEVSVVLTRLPGTEQPVKLTSRPGSDRLYVVRKSGRIIALEEGDDPIEETTVLDLSDRVLTDGERGVLGLAFSNDGETMYVHHTGLDGETRIAAYTMDGDVADPASRVDLLTVDQPHANHNGGEIIVDEEDLLWIGLGDGGAQRDPDERAQDPDDLLGKLLRIDPTTTGPGGRAYGIPDDNPYAEGGGAPEIAAIGLRNPWRFRFDPANGDLWVADVGQSDWEEINRVPADEILGANFGWSRYEASHDHRTDRELTGDADPIVPVYEMNHDDGWCSVTGGPVYRGDAIAGLDGAYLFGDFCRAGLNAMRVRPDGTVDTVVLDDEVSAITSIDATADGTLYVLTIAGEIFRVDPA